jgi:hypothetical protein
MLEIALLLVLTSGLAESAQVSGLAAARCLQVGESADARVAPAAAIAPGAPPLLSFRYYEGKARHRFANSDVMLDDAGH